MGDSMTISASPRLRVSASGLLAISASPRLRVSVSLLALCLLGSGLASPLVAQTASDMVNTKHNLSVSGPGPIRALTETRICIFCHTPHNATPLSPLWNKELEPQNYQVYTSLTLKAGPLPQPSGPTKLCLSCHDGTIAMGAVVNPAGGISMASGDMLPPGSLANFGLDLSGHHPVSFPYHAALPNVELAAAPPPDLVFGGTDEVHCITCHDPHRDTYGRFLLKDNRYSALCVTCHQMTGWSTSAHATSTASVVGILPRPPKTWPTYTQLNEWGCEACHTPHFAPTAEELLNFTAAPPAPFSCTSAGCHSSEPPPIHGASALGCYGVRRDDRAASPPERWTLPGRYKRPSAHHEAARHRADGAAPSRRRGPFWNSQCHMCGLPQSSSHYGSESHSPLRLRHAAGSERRRPKWCGDCFGHVRIRGLFQVPQRQHPRPELRSACRQCHQHAAGLRSSQSLVPSGHQHGKEPERSQHPVALSSPT